MTTSLVTKSKYLTQRVFPYETIGCVGAQGMEPAIISSRDRTTRSTLFPIGLCRIVATQREAQLFGHFRTQRGLETSENIKDVPYTFRDKRKCDSKHLRTQQF